MFFSFFNSCCNQPAPPPYTPPCGCRPPRVQYIPGPQGPQGPRGPMGPMGAQGPAGTNGTNAVQDALYAYTATTQSVDTTTIIPLTTSTATPTTSITLASNALTLGTGTYLISYGATGNTDSATATPLSVQLYANGVANDDEIISSNSLTGTTANLSKTVLYNVTTAGTTLALYNASDATASFTNAYITAMKIV